MTPEYFLGITCTQCDLFCVRGFPDLASAIAFCGEVKIPDRHTEFILSLQCDAWTTVLTSMNEPYNSRCKGSIHITELFKRMDPQIDIHSFPVGMLGRRKR